MNNVFLIRSDAGWHEREDIVSVAAVGRIESFISVGAVSSVEEAYRIIDAQLVEFAEERVQTDAAIAPTTGDVPFVDFVEGDTVTVIGTPHRVLGITFTEVRDTGRVIYTPTFNQNVILDQDARVMNALRKMVMGTGGGRYTAAQPFLPHAKNRGWQPAPEPVAEFLETFPGDGDLGTITTDLEWDVQP